ncbi:MAG: hypothetical protein RL509_246, partial [Pseudomonadota bacterium]
GCEMTPCRRQRVPVAAITTETPAVFVDFARYPSD